MFKGQTISMLLVRVKGVLPPVHELFKRPS